MASSDSEEDLTETLTGYLEENRLDLVKELLEAGKIQNINSSPIYEEFAPIHYCTSKEAVELLCAYGADVNVRSSVLQLTPISTADTPKVWMALLEAGADPTLRSKHAMLRHSVFVETLHKFVNRRRHVRLVHQLVRQTRIPRNVWQLIFLNAQALELLDSKDLNVARKRLRKFGCPEDWISESEGREHILFSECVASTRLHFDSVANERICVRAKAANRILNQFWDSVQRELGISDRFVDLDDIYAHVLDIAIN